MILLKTVRCYGVLLYSIIFEFNRLERKVLFISLSLHKGQKRKEGIPYWIHPLRMALMSKKFKSLSSNSLNNVAIPIALLHDTIEDCNVSRRELSLSLIMIGYTKYESDLISTSVYFLSNRFTSSSHPKMNRTLRKKLEFDRLSKTNFLCQSIKYLDLIDNVKSIKYIGNAKFQKTYLNEVNNLYNIMIDGDKLIRKELKSYIK